MPKFSFITLMVSPELSRSAVTNQIAFDQRDFRSTFEFERTMDRRCQALVSKLETLDTITRKVVQGGPHRSFENQ